ncbi:hypothetical protein EST92_25635 [Streptomyces sp. TM32]|uniref:daptide biosynthesis intramembrane metalloprotease n=1 Tax=Streptomyces sp. TM32 TaxID=1652669 RepID=UPI00101132A4|nr:daptide biosynthesis intramembrane metalloprotease [Streptomyces sp. TM32]RXS69396.1 hypothetical protein EST92_25635 [Streptomyces sp. TM32]
MSAGAIARHPRLAPDVNVCAPATSDLPWVITVADQPRARVSADIARVLALIDGQRDRAALLAALGEPWTGSALDRVIERIAAAGLLDDNARRPAKRRRIAFRPPLTVQVTLFDPSRLLAVTRTALRVVIGRAGLALAVLLALTGLLALGLLGNKVMDVLASPMPLTTAAALSLAMGLATVLHELGHGAVLTHFGGRPHRLGVMLFYLTPALFCDVSDGWRLPRRQQRVAVALAGIIVHCVLGALAAWTAFAAPAGTFERGMLLFSMTCYFLGLANLVPLVKLDGYFALVGHLDVPNLRSKATTDARHMLSARLFGSRYESELPQFRWAVAYGLACMLFPVVLVSVALRRWISGLAGTGVATAVICLALLGLIGWVAGRAGWRALRESWANGANRLRLVVVGGLLVSVSAAAAAFIHVPYKIMAGYVADADGVHLVLPEGGDTGRIRAGVRVRLETQGLVLHSTVGTAVVERDMPRAATAPVTAFLAVGSTATRLPATTYPLTVDGGWRPDAPDTGRALVGDESVPAAVWVWRTYLAPPLKVLGQ